MFQSATRRVTRAIEALLPTTTADAGCPPDTQTQFKRFDGECWVRTCSTSGNCVTHCTVWYITSQNNC
ncbi:hypothetical protein NE236_19625 [Actinoallomurus purpureus]|uniref:hypothetical protein n=1 Tax=Actinoallomurus purpureus TaxID=478114 RepID=UPI002092E6A1|nr:hypothetical protein [Actinoallomurus purpureus]MCO6007194.1 hypothetical protein [Actinoallomurus purpureus]